MEYRYLIQSLDCTGKREHYLTCEYESREQMMKCMDDVMFNDDVILAIFKIIPKDEQK